MKMVPSSHQHQYAESAVLKKVLETAIAPDLLNQLQAETNYTPATSEQQIGRVEALLDDIYRMAEAKGSEHPDTLRQCQALVDMYEETCQFSCAEKLLLRLQIAFQRTYGRDNIMMSTVWNRLAEILMHEVHYPEAETYYLQSLRLIELHHPLPAVLPPHRHASHRFSQQFTLSSATSTVRREFVAQEKEEEEEKAQKLEDTGERTTFVPFVAPDAKDGVRPGRYQPKRCEETSSASSRSAKLGTRRDGGEDKTTATAAANAGDVETPCPPSARGKSGAGEKTYTSCKGDGNEVEGGDNNVDNDEKNERELAGHDAMIATYEVYIPVLRGLADIYWHLQRLSDSERSYRRVLPMLFYLYGLHHEATLSAINSLALVLEADGRAGEALELCERSLQDCISLLGPKHPITQTAVSTVARLKETLGMFGEAEAMYRLAIRYSADALGEAHAQTLTLQRMLGRLLQRTGQYAASLVVLEALAPQYEARYGAYHLDYLDVVFMQGELCVYLDDFLQARAHYRKCYEHRCLLLRTRHHPLVYEAKFALGKTYHMACSWRHDMVAFRDNLAETKRLLTFAFYGTIAVYGQAPITTPLVVLPTMPLDTKQEDRKEEREEEEGTEDEGKRMDAPPALETTAESSSSSSSSSNRAEPNANERQNHNNANRNRNNNNNAKNLDNRTDTRGHPRPNDDDDTNDGSDHGQIAHRQRTTSHGSINSATSQSHNPAGSLRASMRASLDLTCLLEAECDGTSVEMFYQQRGILRVECVEMALYLGRFYLEFDMFVEAELLYRLLADVLRVQRTQNPSLYQRLFTNEIQAEILQSYGQVLESRRQYARAVTVLEQAVALYARVREEVAASMQELDTSLSALKEELEAMDGHGPASSETIASTIKRMMVTSKEDLRQQTRQKLQRVSQAWEDCQEQYNYAMSLYQLSS